MKKFKLYINDEYACRFAHDDLQFAVANKPIKGVINLLDDTFFDCREELTDIVYDLAIGSVSDEGFDPKRIRIVSKIVVNKRTGNKANVKAEQFRQGSIRALRILNKLESLAGWPSTTNLYDLSICPEEMVKNMESWGTEFMAAYFNGPRRWMISSHMVSLFCLIIRIGYEGLVDMDGRTGWNTMSKRLLSWAKSQKYDRSVTNDTVKETIQYWLPLMKSFKAVFGSSNTKKNFKHREFKSYDGIHTLLTEQSPRSDFCEKVAKMKARVDKQSKRVKARAT